MKAPITIAAVVGAVLSNTAVAEAATTTNQANDQPTLDCSSGVQIAALGSLGQPTSAAETKTLIAAKGQRQSAPRKPPPRKACW
jgi:hypothetical protein